MTTIKVLQFSLWSLRWWCEWICDATTVGKRNQMNCLMNVERLFKRNEPPRRKNWYKILRVEFVVEEDTNISVTNWGRRRRDKSLLYWKVTLIPSFSEKHESFPWKLIKTAVSRNVVMMVISSYTTDLETQLIFDVRVEISIRKRKGRGWLKCVVKKLVKKKRERLWFPNFNWASASSSLPL